MSRKLILLTLFTFALVGTALAKIDPYVEDPEAEWGDVSEPATVHSWRALAAYVGRLGAEDDVDAFVVSFPEAREDWRFEIMIPVCGQHFKAFFPAIAVIGPGLDVPEDGVLPFDLPDGSGAEIFVEETYIQQYAEKGIRSIMPSNSVIYELPTYFTTPRTINIPEAGDYTIAIFEPDGHIGAYMFALIGGDHDMFGDRSREELDASYDALFDGSWMGEDCDTANRFHPDTAALMIAGG
jgi:hypothetical protein